MERMERQLTAVNWLEEALSQNLKEIIVHCNVELMESLFEKAKKKEKEQIMDAYKADLYPCLDEEAEQYYNETFKSE